MAHSRLPYAMRAFAVLGLLLASSATGPALVPHGLALVGSAPLAFGPCALMLYVAGEAVGTFWVFNVAGENIVSYACVEHPLVPGSGTEHE